jgi:WD40 repeat protein
MLSDRYFASSSITGEIKIYDVDDFECINIFGHDERIDTLLMLKDRRLVSGSYDGNIIIYNY